MKNAKTMCADMPAGRAAVLAKASFAAFAAAFAAAFLDGCSGCSKEPVPEVYADRSQDPEYQAKLGEVQKGRQASAGARNRAAAKMHEYVAMAKAELGGDATDDAIRAEIEGHPEKYPGWKDLEAENAKRVAELEQARVDAMALVRERVRREQAEQKAIDEGRARAK